MFRSAVVLPALLLFPVLVSAAPGSIYGKALQKARDVSSQAEKSRTLPPAKPVPAKTSFDQKKAKELFSAITRAKLKRYPKSGAAGINEMLAKKIISPAQLQLPAKKTSVSEKELMIAWFGSEAGKVKNKEVFPLFFTKPAAGTVVVVFNNGTVTTLKKRPRSVTGVISILRSTAKNKKSNLWSSYLKAAGRIDKASK